MNLVSFNKNLLDKTICLFFQKKEKKKCKEKQVIKFSWVIH